MTGDDWTEHRILTEGRYEAASMALIPPFIRPNTVAIDVGAHIGVYALFLSLFAEHVLAVEPFPVNYDRLERNIGLNEGRSVEVLRIALGRRPDVRHAVSP